MIKEAKVVDAFSTKEENGTTTLVLKRNVMFGKIIFLICCSLFVAIHVQMNDLTQYKPNPLDILLFVVLAWFLLIKKVKYKIEFTEDGVVFRNKLYKYENIKSVGYDNPYNNTYSYGKFQHAIRMALKNIFYYVFFIHGTQRIKINSGLTEHKAVLLFQSISDCFSKYGQSYH